MDYPVVILTGSIIVLGLLILGSASVDFSQVDYTSFQEMNFFGRLLHLDFGAIANQLVGMIIGIIGIGFILSVDFEDLHKISKYLYIFNIIMLVAVLLLGFTALGAQRWIGIGSFKFQPSELSKIIMVICFADYLACKEGHLSRWRDL
ncbi:MAG: FtsW/RodA/SpoVE family cell cycle protein, partial [Clostridia bacterium]|nr:FtsW/RodA/SpoVE family cell cycle protein [Clostridia bacterium]